MARQNRILLPGTKFYTKQGVELQVVEYIKASNIRVKRMTDGHEFKCSYQALVRQQATGEKTVNTKLFDGELPETAVWIPGFELNYAVDRRGSIWSAKRGRLLRMKCPCLSGQGPNKDKETYPVVTLSMNGVYKTFLVHRLIAETFIPNPDNLPQVNHKDGVKIHNEVENLEWVTEQDNVIHSFSIDIWT